MLADERRRMQQAVKCVGRAGAAQLQDPGPYARDAADAGPILLLLDRVPASRNRLSRAEC